MSFEEGALLEPLAVAVHATNRAGVKLGHTVLICGAGSLYTVVCLFSVSVCVKYKSSFNSHQTFLSQEDP